LNLLQNLWSPLLGSRQFEFATKFVVPIFRLTSIWICFKIRGPYC